MEIVAFTDRDKQRYSELKSQIKQGWLMFAQGILEVRNSKLYRLEYDTFEGFCETELGFTRQRGYELVRAAETIENVSHGLHLPQSQLPQTERQARPLTRLEPEVQRVAWAQAYRLIESAEVNYNLSPIGDILPTTESQARPLTRLEPELQRVAWAQVLESNAPETITAKKKGTLPKYSRRAVLSISKGKGN